MSDYMYGRLDDAPGWLHECVFVKADCPTRQVIDVLANCAQIEGETFDRVEEETTSMQKQVGGGHYKKCKIQPVEYALANGLGFCESNVVKYVTRWRDKGGVTDLRKAIHYLEMLIDHEESH